MRSKDTVADLQNLLALDDFARLRWGPTGFCCPHCGHTAAWTLRCRPRVRECRKCHRQTSVTSGTLLEHTRLPIEAWALRGQQFERGDIPTTSQLRAALGIARSTAWLLNQKLMACSRFAAIAPPEGAAGMLVSLPVRPPQPTPPMHEDAPAHVRELHLRHLARRRSKVHVTVALHLVDRTAGVDDIALSDRQVTEYPRRPPTVPHDNVGLPRYIRGTLAYARMTVSLRWLPRWIEACVMAWNVGGGVRPPPWAPTAIRIGPRPLRTLDPWRRAAA